MFICCHRTRANHWLPSFTVDRVPNGACCFGISHTWPVITLDRGRAPQQKRSSESPGWRRVSREGGMLKQHDMSHGSQTSMTNASCKHEYTPEARDNISMCTCSGTGRDKTHCISQTVEAFEFHLFCLSRGKSHFQPLPIWEAITHTPNLTSLQIS